MGALRATLRFRNRHAYAAHRVLSLAAVSLLALVGTYVLGISRAASPVVPAEAESGARAGGVTQIADVSASGSNAVKFGGDSAFRHPGVFLSTTQLDFIKSKLATGQQPWVAGEAKIFSRYRNPDYVPGPVTTLGCGIDAASCDKLIDDSIAAYVMAM